jgi:hypothetical protein
MKLNTKEISKQDLACCGNCGNYAHDENYYYCEIDEKIRFPEAVCRLWEWDRLFQIQRNIEHQDKMELEERGEISVKLQNLIYPLLMPLIISGV